VFLATPESLPYYLQEKGLIASHERAEIAEMGGGVSNTVLQIVTPTKRWVLKQALAKLKVKLDWYSSVQRMEREVECLAYLSKILPQGAVPGLIHHDSENHLYIMTSGAEDAVNWKTELLEIKTRPQIAAQAGSLLGIIHRMSYGDEAAVKLFGDKQYFQELRIEPFYFKIAEVYPQLADKIGSLATTLVTSNISFVHGDFSPKNILINKNRILLLDFEVGHFGHPGFDLAFMLAHLTLKTAKFWEYKEDYLGLIMSFWSAYLGAANFESESWHERSFLPHLGCILLARMDGKSPIDYLPEENKRQRVKALASSLITREIPSMRVYLDVLARAG